MVAHPHQHRVWSDGMQCCTPEICKSTVNTESKHGRGCLLTCEQTQMQNTDNAPTPSASAIHISSQGSFESKTGLECV